MTTVGVNGLIVCSTLGRVSTPTHQVGKSRCRGRTESSEALTVQVDDQISWCSSESVSAPR